MANKINDDDDTLHTASSIILVCGRVQSGPKSKPLPTYE